MRKTNHIRHNRWDEIAKQIEIQRLRGHRGVNVAGTWKESYLSYHGRFHGRSETEYEARLKILALPIRSHLHRRFISKPARSSARNATPGLGYIVLASGRFICLVKNLDNPEYMDIILDGKKSPEGASD